MKVLLCLFSLYILLLSGMPCRADDNCCIDEIMVNTARTQPGDNHGQPKESPSPCSPFFACGACHGFVVPEPILTAPAEQILSPGYQSVYNSRLLPDFSYPIWQPPQLV